MNYGCCFVPSQDILLSQFLFIVTQEMRTKSHIGLVSSCYCQSLGQDQFMNQLTVDMVARQT